MDFEAKQWFEEGIFKKKYFYRRIKAMHMIKKYKNWNFPICEKNVMALLMALKHYLIKLKTHFVKKKV